MSGPAGQWEHRPESFHPGLRQHQPHYDRQWSLSRVLAGGNVASGAPEGIDSGSSDETRTRP